ncbi:transglutaminase domain-containing protein [Sandarakinorhabdus sp. AAP62]|uniref:transglutaminase domain-containing protein n=1 Tax=Sandarakinorhabdus sp. AAP62 TaxID=1248916 RepID=UPI00036A6CA7|nr:transglutaminase domain-containing protein [Sandarakinorhabdus sp. AAP62]
MAMFEAFLADPAPYDGLGLYPVPPETDHQRVLGTDFAGTAPQRVVHDADGRTAAWLLPLRAGRLVRLRHRFEPAGAGLPDAAFVPGTSPFERASPALAVQITSLELPAAPHARCQAVIQFVADHFDYGRREQALGADADAMPALACGLTPGTCVDMHTLAVAALRAAGLAATYVIGAHVADGRSQHPTGHCWLNVRAPETPPHWDISHHAQYGQRQITPVLNPRPGRRFALSHGRGLQFDGPDGPVSLPSLSGVHMLTGPLAGTKLPTMGRFV